MIAQSLSSGLGLAFEITSIKVRLARLIAT